MKTNTSMPRRHERGFSLIEMAMVLLILGTLLGGVLVAVSQTTENGRRTTARNQLREIESALYGFAQVNGRLPCPAVHNSNGYESPSGGGTGGVACTSNNGFVPTTTLNLNGAINADGLLLDPWQNPIRYSVAATLEPQFTNADSIRDFFAGGGTFNAAGMLKVCPSSSCTAGDELATMLPAVVFSMGADWSSYNSPDEQANAGNGSTKLGTYNITNGDAFVSADYAEDLFDDQLIWLSPYVLVNKMISAGQLP
jgi:prepilin-type N-terminal cleavage/methylation domain-containing protein